MDDADKEGREFMRMIDRVIEKPEDHDMQAVVQQIESFFGVPQPEARSWIDLLVDRRREQHA